METEESIKWLIASGGWVVALFTVWMGYRERREAREEDTLREALNYFTGGTQKRSIGIAFIEGRFRNDPRFQDIWIPVISNQFVYLLIETDSEDEAHEIRNLVRVYRLLSSIPSFKCRFSSVHGDVLDVIETKLENDEKGLTMDSETS